MTAMVFAGNWYIGGDASPRPISGKRGQGKIQGRPLDQWFNFINILALHLESSLFQAGEYKESLASDGIAVRLESLDIAFRKNGSASLNCHFEKNFLFIEKRLACISPFSLS